MCLAQGHNTVTPVRLEPVAPHSQVKHSTTEPQCAPHLSEFFERGKKIIFLAISLNLCFGCSKRIIKSRRFF